MSKSAKQGRNGKPKLSGTKVERDDDLEDDVDSLFKLPLTEFTGARNTLAARLKKSGRSDESVFVKALAKPSVSAWAVNQLYWNHREAFDRLLASGERFHKAQASAGKAADMRGALDARREALTHLSDLATSLLREAGHNPTPDTIHRITTTLEGISAYASRSDAPVPGRLTNDVDPPGFELFGSSIPSAGITPSKEKPERITASQKSTSAATNTRREAAPQDREQKLAEVRRAKIANAKVSLQDAKKWLTQARARAQRLETAQQKAEKDSKVAEQNKRDAEERFEKATAASRDAARRARSVALEADEAAKALQHAERKVEERSEELEKLFGE